MAATKNISTNGEQPRFLTIEDSAHPERQEARTDRKLFRRGLLALGAGSLAAGSAYAQSVIDFQLLFYDEAEGRTKVVDPELYLKKDFGPRGNLTIKSAYDAISGASPTGEMPSANATSSASSSHTSATIPRAKYKDNRKALAIGYDRRFGRHLPSIELSYSKETDYSSRGISLVDSIDFMGGDGTLSLGVSALSDVVSPVGQPDSHDKKTTSASIGWSQVLTPRDLLAVFASQSKVTGFLNDPYKVVTVGTEVIPEVRPDSRNRLSFVVKYGHYYLSRGAIKFFYRFYTDSWNLDAHTLEATFEKRFGLNLIVAPRVRFYQQSGASFFAYEFAAPRDAMSADYRLSAFHSIEGGIDGSYQLREGLWLKAGVALQSQTGTDRVSVTTGGSSGGSESERDGSDFQPMENDGGGGGGGSISVSPADLTTLTATIGFSYQF